MVKPVFVGRQLARRSFGEDSNDLSGDVTCTSSADAGAIEYCDWVDLGGGSCQEDLIGGAGVFGGHLGLVNGEAQLVTCEFDRRSSG
jgi:hypothetical protein